MVLATSARSSLNDTEYGFPLSHVSIEASNSAFSSTNEASLLISCPRWVGDMSRHSGFSKALRAATTALSTSLALAASTLTISDSSVGFMLLICVPDVADTHWLFIQSPVGWLYSWPLGVLSFAVSDAILTETMQPAQYRTLFGEPSCKLRARVNARSMSYLGCKHSEMQMVGLSKPQIRDLGPEKCGVSSDWHTVCMSYPFIQ